MRDTAGQVLTATVPSRSERLIERAEPTNGRTPDGVDQEVDAAEPRDRGLDQQPGDGLLVGRPGAGDHGEPLVLQEPVRWPAAAPRNGR